MLHQPPRGRTGPALIVGSLVLLPLLVACGGGEGGAAVQDKQASASVTAAASAGVVAPAKIEVIADLTGCTAEIRVDADELREGVCRTKKANYRITTFPEERYKLTWLDAASVYGGKYLVGPRWVVSAKPKVLEQLRSTLGGTIQELSGIGPSPSAS